MTQNTALAFSVCVNDSPDKINRLVEDLAIDYNIDKIGDLKLITIRHGSNEVFERIYGERKIYLEEKIRSNIQLVMDKNELL